MPSFLRPIDVTRPTARFSSASRRAYPPTIPVAPTITRRFWPEVGTFMNGPEELQKRNLKPRDSSLPEQRRLVHLVDAEKALCTKPRAVCLHESIEIAERSRCGRSTILTCGEQVGLCP
jgi:hypothetical protein